MPENRIWANPIAVKRRKNRKIFKRCSKSLPGNPAKRFFREPAAICERQASRHSLVCASPFLCYNNHRRLLLAAADHQIPQALRSILRCCYKIFP